MNSLFKVEAKMALLKNGLTLVIKNQPVILLKVKKNGKFLEWYDNGKKYIEQEYKDGKRHGLMFSWYDTGSKKEQKYYTMDIINGVHLQWYENGQKKLEGNYINGKYDGIWTQWFANGQKFIEGKYNEDMLIGFGDSGIKMAKFFHQEFTKIANK